VTAAVTLGDLVTMAAERSPDRGFTFQDEDAELRLSYAELDATSRGLAAALAEYAAPGARVVMIYPPGLAFVSAFFGAQRLGLIAVPVYPPNGPLPAWIQRLEALLSDADPALVLTTRELLDLKAMAGLEIGPAHIQWLATDGLGDADPGWRAPRVSGSDAALLQYTSGSTGQPRGVILRHANLVANQHSIARGFDFRHEDVVVSWLPVYHDMGLIGCVLQPIFNACDACLLSPLAFLARPLRWVEAVARHGGTVSGGPNFAFDLCARRAGELMPGSIDLSAWRLAFTGAEPVRPETLDRFAAAFGPFGFRRGAFYPCYGLAEASLIVTGASITDRPRLVAVDRAALDEGRAVVASPGAPAAATLVSAGAPVIDGEVIIVDPASLGRLPDGQVGEIWVRGTSVAAGYWRNDEATLGTFGARLASCSDDAGQDDAGHGAAGPGVREPRHAWLRTGDLGFFTDGELVVTGRIKEVMIIRGRNVHPTDVEVAAQEADSRLRRGCGAAFVAGAHGDDGVVLVQETRADGTAAAELLPAVRRSVAERTNVPLAAVLLVAPHTVPKTSSGKLRRLACRDLYLSGAMEPLAAWRRPPVAS
jgi:acyl-CoA synthetase (AMP-forming)/AMP-acid ligase II